MNTKKIILIFVALIVLVVVFLIIFPKFNKKPSTTLPVGTPSVEQQLEQKLNGLTIPNDVEKIELKNVSGGEAMGIATRTEVVADLPELPIGKSYQVLLGNGTKTVLLGTMHQAKGGWILEYDSSKYPGYDQITVVRGSEHILEGSF